MHVTFASVPATYLSPYLAPCTRHNERYQELFPERLFDEWSTSYHRDVRQAVEEYLAYMESGNVSELPPKAAEIAEIIFYWLDEEDIAALDRSSFGAVMLEYLRVYECVLKEYNYNLTTEILFEAGMAIATTIAPVPTNVAGLYMVNLLATQGLRRRTIARELAIARGALDRVLALTAGTAKLDPLKRELQRLQEASLDMRNRFALAGDAAMCLPTRTWSTREVLRDLPLSTF